MIKKFWRWLTFPRCPNCGTTVEYKKKWLISYNCPKCSKKWMWHQIHGRQ
jgi:predicted RNA-binding Zn-ribbon protein involved in translation (DUF1610 family)